MYPSEWSDDQVMGVLFSPFRENRYVNPRSWDHKMDFWKDMVRRRCITSKSLVFNARELPAFFERNGKLPACMNIVLEDLIRSGTIKPLPDYVASAGGWMSWSADMFLRRPVRWTYRTMVKQPISWAYSKLFSGADEDEDVCRPKTSEQIAASLPDEQFVFVDLVKSVAEAIYRHHCRSVTCRLTDELIGYDELAEECKDICTDRESFDVAIRELCQQKRCIVATGVHGDKVLRLISSQSDNASTPTDTDIKIYRLKVAEAKLEEAIKSVTEEIEQCRLNAKVYIQQGKKSAALKCLRRKKLLDSRQAQHEQAVEKINAMLHMLQETESQKQVIDAFSSGVEAFKQMRNQYGLNESSVDDTMSEIQEVFEDSSTMNQIMSQPVISTETVDDDELRQELDDLLADKVDSNISATPLRPPADGFDVHNLPNVPQHEPGSSFVATSMPKSREQLLDGD